MKKVIVSLIIIIFCITNVFSQKMEILKVGERHLDLFKKFNITYVEPNQRDLTYSGYNEVFKKEYFKFMSNNLDNFSYPLDVSKVVLNIDTTDIRQRNYEKYAELMSLVCFRHGNVVIGYKSINVEDEKIDKLEVFEIYSIYGRYVIVEVFSRNKNGVWECEDPWYL